MEKLGAKLQQIETELADPSLYDVEMKVKLTALLADREQVIRNYARAGVVNHSLLPRLLQPVGDAVVRGMEATPGQGTWMWALVLSVVGFVYAGRREWLAIYAPMVLLWATLMIAAPTVTPFRYMEPVILVVPIGLVVLLGTDRSIWEPKTEPPSDRGK